MLFSPSSLTLEAALRDVGSADPRTRAIAADALADVADDGGREQAVTALVPLLQDVRHEVRAAAALALGTLKRPQAVPALLARLDDDSSEVRQSVAIALGRIGDPSAFETLADALENGPPDLRFQAAVSLAEIDAARAYEPLVRAIRDGDAEVRESVAAALALVGDRRAAGWLAELLTDARRETRFEAACTLAAMGDARATGPLSELVADDDLAWRAIEGLESLGDRQALPALARLVGRRFAPRILRVRAAAALLGIDPAHPSAAEARTILDKASRAWRSDVRGVAEEFVSRARQPD